MSENNELDVIENKIFVNKVLILMAEKISHQLASFSGWMIVGFGAAISLLVANIAEVAKYIKPECIGLSVKLFLGAVVLNVIQRYMAAKVASVVTMLEKLESIPEPKALDLAYFRDQIEKVTFWPARIYLKWMNNKISNGDYTISGRMQGILAQIQAYLVFAQMILLVLAAYVIGNAL